MPTLFAALLQLSAAFGPAPALAADLDLRLVWKPVRPAELDVLAPIVEDLRSVPVPVVDPFQLGVMVHLSGDF